MNKRSWIILAILALQGYTNQRTLVQKSQYSIGLINSSLKKLQEEGYIDQNFQITEKARSYMEESKPRRAVILAAGMGTRMAPANRTPKGLCRVNGQPLIERIIQQLHTVGITEIYLVTGYMTERFEYLIDKYNVEIIYNPEYSRKDSLHSLSIAADKLDNCYIVPSNIWFSRNPFNEYEFFSWYAVADYMDDESFVRLNRNLELVYTEDESGGNSMLGLCYLLSGQAEELRRQLLLFSGRRKYAHTVWERALFGGSKMITYARTMLGQQAYVINTYEDLRSIDSESQDLNSKRIRLICQVFDVSPEDITNISPLSRGMTNKLMRFSVDGRDYILREPGEGSNELTSRRHEADVYAALEGTGLAENLIYLSGEDGYKITEFLENIHECDVNSEEDVARSIAQVRRLHEAKLKVGHSFDLMEMLISYEKLRDSPSSFSDYDEVRAHIVELIRLLERFADEKCLCHVDSVADNLLISEERVTLIDWEYAGMSEPHIDIAMFCIYADYDLERINQVIDLYFENKATPLDRFKVYAYAAAGGLLWSVWSEYKAIMGVNYAEYSMKQYRYARHFYNHAMEVYNSSEHFGEQ